MPDAPEPIDYICSHCGQPSVTREAWAEWDRATQAWVISDLFDFTFCHHCHRPTELVSRPIS